MTQVIVSGRGARKLKISLLTAGLAALIASSNVAAADPAALAAESAPAPVDSVVEASRPEPATAETPASPAPAAPAAVAAPMAPAPRVAAATDTYSSRKGGTLPPPAAEVLNPWWKRGSDKDFNVQYIGQVSGQPSMAIRFSKNVSDPATAARYIRVTGPQGETVASNWQAGANPYVMVQPGLAPGRYRVFIDPNLSSAQGEALGLAMSGPVYIQ